MQLGWFTHVVGAGSPRATARDTLAAPRAVMRRTVDEVLPEHGPVAAPAAVRERVR